MVHEGRRFIAVLFFDHDTRTEWWARFTLQPLFTPRKVPVPIVRKAVWDPGAFRTSAEILAPHRYSIPDHSLRSQSLYRLSYRAHEFWLINIYYYTNSWYYCTHISSLHAPRTPRWEQASHSLVYRETAIGDRDMAHFLSTVPIVNLSFYSFIFLCLLFYFVPVLFFSIPQCSSFR